jgi:hypothetical protein
MKRRLKEMKVTSRDGMMSTQQVNIRGREAMKLSFSKNKVCRIAREPLLRSKWRESNNPVSTLRTEMQTEVARPLADV